MRRWAKVGLICAGVAAGGLGIFFVASSTTIKCHLDNAAYCSGNKCDLTIKVASCADDGSGISIRQLNVFLDPNTLHLCEAKKITWTIDTDPQNPTYVFAENGIEFNDASHNKSADPADLPPDEKAKDKVTYTWHFKHKHFGDSVYFPYTINVVKANNTACASKDPRISSE
jgi:hypothetical protein